MDCYRSWYNEVTPIRLIIEGRCHNNCHGIQVVTAVAMVNRV